MEVEEHPVAQHADHHTYMAMGACDTGQTCVFLNQTDAKGASGPQAFNER